MRTCEFRILSALGAVVATLMIPIAAPAMPLQGTITFGGNIGPVSDFTAVGVLTFPDPVTVIGATGHFGALNSGPEPAVSTFEPIRYDPTDLPISPLWTSTVPAGEFSFELEALEIALRTQNLLFLQGTGTLHASAFDTTDGEWTLTAQNLGNVSFTFTSTTVATPMPEPGAPVMFMAGLLVVGFALRGQLVRS